MKHNRTRVLKWTMARTPTVRAIRAWRKLLPDWTPTLDQLQELDTRPHEHVAAVRVLSDEWEANDPRWDVLLALLEWERRTERDRIMAEYWAQEGRVEAWMKKWMDADDDHQVHVRGDQVDAEEVPAVRSVLPDDETTENVLPDPEPVQHEPGEGEAEDPQGDLRGGQGEGPGVGERSPLVHELRDKAAGE